MKMKYASKICTLLIISCLIFSFVFAQDNPQWVPVSSANIQSAAANKTPGVINMYQINWKTYSQLFYANSAAGSSFTITIPTPASGWETFTVAATDVLSPQAQLNFPDIKAYRGA